VLAANTGLTLISVADEIALGREAQHRVSTEVRAIDGPVQAYVASIGGRLSAHVGGPRYPYSFSVANDRQINAFALPGGPVWINRGAIELSATEAQLAGVLAHEIAHISQRHAATQISKGLVADGLLGLLGAMLGNSGGAQTAGTGARLLANGYLMKFTRDDEREADRVGVEIVRRAGWDPHGMLEFMERLRQRAGGDPPSVAAFLSTHPSPAERIGRLRTQLQRIPRRGVRNSRSFHSMQRALARIPVVHRRT
jgi:predicted Zn-dependent protease